MSTMTSVILVLIDIAVAIALIYGIYKVVSASHAGGLLVFTLIFAGVAFLTRWNWLKIPAVILIILWLFKFARAFKVFFAGYDYVEYEWGVETFRESLSGRRFFFVLIIGIGLIWILCDSFQIGRYKNHMIGLWNCMDGSIVSFYKDGTVEYYRPGFEEIDTGSWRVTESGFNLTWTPEFVDNVITADIDRKSDRVQMESNWEEVDGDFYTKVSKKPMTLTIEGCREFNVKE